MKRKEFENDLKLDKNCKNSKQNNKFENKLSNSETKYLFENN